MPNPKPTPDVRPEEILLVQRVLFRKMSRLQALLCRIVRHRMETEGTSTAQLARALGSNHSNVDRFASRTSAITSRAPLLPKLLAYARGSGEAATPSDQALLQEAEAIFAGMKAYGDREFSLCLAAPEAIDLYFEVQIMRAKLAADRPAWLFAEAFDRQSDLVRDLIDRKLKALEQLSLPTTAPFTAPSARLTPEGRRLRAQLADEEGLRERFEAAYRSHVRLLERYRDEIRAACQLLVKKPFKSLTEISAAIKRHRGLLHLVNAANPDRISLEQMRETLELVSALAKQHGHPVPESTQALLMTQTSGDGKSAAQTDKATADTHAAAPAIQKQSAATPPEPTIPPPKAQEGPDTATPRPYGGRGKSEANRLLAAIEPLTHLLDWKGRIGDLTEAERLDVARRGIDFLNIAGVRNDPNLLRRAFEGHGDLGDLFTNLLKGSKKR